VPSATEISSARQQVEHPIDTNKEIRSVFIVLSFYLCNFDWK
jgi:hypothetical protein